MGDVMGRLHSHVRTSSPVACPDAIDTARAGAAKELAVHYVSSRFRQSALAAALLFALAPAHADEAPSDLDTVVVTATRTEQSEANTLSALTVIDRADIERLQPLSLQDILRGTPGLSIANNGGPGKNTSLFLRGTEAGHVLVLIDGVKIGSATAGLPAIQDIPVDQIERIEIVRGPFSSLYGSEAIGGVIQIFTRRAQGTFEPNVSLGAGSYGEVRGNVGVAGKGEQGWYSAQLAHENTDGINSCRGKPSPGGAGCFTDEPDRDGYRNTSLSLQGGYRFNEAWDADAHVLRTDGYSEFDGSFTNQADTEQHVAGARLRFRPTDKLALTLNAGQSADLSENFEDGVYSSTFNTHRDLGSLQGDLGIAGGLLTLGYDWQRDRVDSDTEYENTRRIDDAVFGQWQQTFGSQSWQASARHDDNSQFGGKTTGSLLWGWELSSALRLTASAGTAFKAPTFNDLYYPGFGNAHLRPEHSRSYELGLRGTPGWGKWSLNAFENQVDDLIAYDAALFAPGNVSRARIRGVEAVAATTLAQWDVAATVTWLDPRNESDDSNHGNLLARRARDSVRVDADRHFGALSAGASVYAVDKRYDDLGNTRELGGYALTDLRVAYALNAAWKVQLSANNVFDRRYETAAFYNQPGRNVLLTASWRPANP
ncbi:MAG: TonB-dependent vitamin B12 receptor [Dokdonella sp.]